MSDETAVSLQNVGKMYKLYSNRLDMALEATGLIRLFPWRKARAREFWALRNINLEVKRGERLGIIGRNGAGKSTLLKLLTGNLAVTEGRVVVNGTVQALLTSGSGFHPEFTGYENVRSSLVYQGLNPDQIEAAVKDIAEFTELGDFLNQPFKLYSAGMQARLAFATATVLNPDVLIVDEILGAGDAYFWGKSIERMKGLVMSGATVLIVSHALDQISRFCEHAVWMDRGKIVYYGTPITTIGAYEEYIHKLEDRRLQARNRKKQAGENPADATDLQSDILTIRFCPSSSSSRHGLDLSRVDLYEGNLLYESLQVGDTQDSDALQTMYVVTDSSEGWSNPMVDGARTFRRLHGGQGVAGDVRCELSHVNFNEAISCEVTYRADEASQVECWRQGVLIVANTLPPSSMWTTQKFNLESLFSSPLSESDSKNAETQKVRRWNNEGSLTIKNVTLLDGTNNKKAVFTVGEQLLLDFEAHANQDGRFEVIPVVVLYRLDGIKVSSHIGDAISLQMKKGEKISFGLTFPEINLGDGDYVFSVALYRTLNQWGEAEIYDLIDRSYEFRVKGNNPYNGLFTHCSVWRSRK